jgi:hypothetical protein
METGLKIVRLEDHMPSHRKAAKEEPGPKPKRGPRSHTATRLETPTLLKLKALSVQQRTDLSGAIEWLFDQLPEVKTSIERFMAGK